MAQILAIDDETSILESYRVALEDVHDITLVENGEEGLKALESGLFDLVLLDISMPGMSGLEVLSEIRQEGYDCAVLMITVHKDVEIVVEAMKSGADDYLTKPFKVADLWHTVDRSLKVIDLERKNRSLQASLEATESRGEIVYVSEAMKSAFGLLEKAAPTDSSVLITGESGTGKELAAQFIHERSNRSGLPLITVNCAAIPDTLLESELFGHEKGAFSGALERKTGKFELANRGTIFLDEIGALPLELQSKLLRTLETRIIERVGGNKPIHLDIRWIAATNRDLDKSVENGEFRNDLFFRLNVIAVNLPPLRQRREDISLLVDHFIQQFADELKTPALELSDEVKEVFEVYNWPGNVRELRNLIERLTVLEPGPEVAIDGLPEHMLSAYAEEIGVPITTATGSRYKGAVEEFRRAFIVRAMRVAEGSQVRAAEILGLHRNTLIHHLRSFNIGPEEYRQESTPD